jgi:hypothetical protein
MFQALTRYSLSHCSSSPASIFVEHLPLPTPFLNFNHIFNTDLCENFEDSYIQVFGLVREFGKTVVSSQWSVEKLIPTDH